MSASKTRRIIPAQPGWHVSFLVGGNTLSDEPIIAWEIIRKKRGLTQRPITADNDLDLERPDNQWVIKRPDGRYLLPGGGWLDNEADVIDFFLEEAHRRARARKKKK